MSVGAATAEAVRHLGAAVPAVTDPLVRQTLQTIVQRAGGPFEVAVVGRLKSGKSTLVNALLGRIVAPTDSGECTRLVTRFLRGDADYVQSIGDDEQVIAESPLGTQPVAADTLRAGVSRLDVYLTSAFLDGFVIADTPGKDSLEGELSAKADAYLDQASVEAAKRADAVILVTGKPVVKETEMKAIEEFIQAVGDRHGLSMFVVLNRADSVTGGLAAAQQEATNLFGGPLRGKVAGVVPASALAIQAARCGLIDARTTGDLNSLVGIDPKLFASILQNERYFSMADCDVPADVRTRLVSRLGLTAIKVIVEHLRAHPGNHGGAFAALNAAGNATELETQLTRLRRRADGMKAAAAAVAAERAARGIAVGQPPDIRWVETGPEDRAVILDAVNRLRDLSGPYSIVEQLHVLEQVHHTPELLADDEAAELERLFTPGPARDRVGAPSGDVSAAALAAAGRWQEATFDFNPTRQHIARVARRAYLSLLEPSPIMSGAS